MKALALLTVATFVGGCATVKSSATTPAHVLLTDSALYHVVLRDGAYRAELGFRFTNPTEVTLSRVHCHVPPRPLLEKNVGGAWVVAFEPPEFLCESLPPFRI